MRKKLPIALTVLTIIAFGLYHHYFNERWEFKGDYSLTFDEIVSYAWGHFSDLTPDESIHVVYSFGFGVYDSPSQQQVAFRKKADSFFQSFSYRMGENPQEKLPPAGGIEISFADGCSPYRIYWADDILWVPWSAWIPYQPDDPDAFDRQMQELVAIYKEYGNG